MTAVVQDRYGAPEQVLQLAQIARPALRDGCVHVRVRATSVNTPDWLAVSGAPYFVRGLFGLRRPRVRVRGSDVAGIVEGIGAGVEELVVGDEVFGSSWDDGRDASGTFAEHTVVPAARLARKPAALSFEDAAASVMSGITALTAMHHVANVQAGQRVLIHGASGGVGTFAVQMAKARGAHVTGVCSTGNVELVRSLGADCIVDYKQEDVTRGDARFDVVLDNVMNHAPGAMLSLLTPTGLYLPNSVGEGRLLGSLPKMAWARLTGGRHVKAVNISVTREHLDALAALLTSGAVRVVVDATYPLSEAAAAVAHMMSHRARGKIVVKV